MSHHSPHPFHACHRRQRRVAFAVGLAILCSVSVPSCAQTTNESVAFGEEVRELRALVRELQARDARIEAELADVKAQLRQQSTQPPRHDNDEAAVAEPGHGPFAPGDSMPQSTSATAAPTSSLLQPEDRSALDFLRGNTINFAFDGY